MLTGFIASSPRGSPPCRTLCTCSHTCDRMGWRDSGSSNCSRLAASGRRHGHLQGSTTGDWVTALHTENRRQPQEHTNHHQTSSFSNRHFPKKISSSCKDHLKIATSSLTSVFISILGLGIQGKPGEYSSPQPVLHCLSRAHARSFHRCPWKFYAQNECRKAAEIHSAAKASALQIGEENFALSAKSHLLRAKLFLFYTSAENDHLGIAELRT